MNPDEFETFDPRQAAVVAGEVVPGADSPVEIRLAEFGAALRAPATDAELAGLPAALQAFATQRGSWHAGRRPARTAGVVGIGVAAIVLVGGVAAAATGSLPAPLQRFAHSALGAPNIAPTHPRESVAESTTDSASAAISDSRTDSSSAKSTTTPTGGPTSTPRAGSVASSAFGLCQAWFSHGRPVNANSAIVRGLTPLAGAAGIETYCTALLAPGPTSRPTLTGRPVPTPSLHPSHGHAVLPGPKVSPPVHPRVAPSASPHNPNQ